MEFKIILYLTAGIGYFIYKQYQKLQAEASERKAEIETNQTQPRRTPEPAVIRQQVVPTPKPAQTKMSFNTRKQSVAPVPIATNELVNMEKGVMPVFDFSYDDHLIESTKERTAKNISLGVDMQQMIIWSEILGKPVSLRT